MTERKPAVNGRSQQLAHAPSPYERAAEIAPTHPNARLMRRMNDSNFWEVRRLTTLLVKIKRYKRRMETLEKTAALHDALETKGVSV